MLSKVYEFRPLPNYFEGRVRRYADGKWLEDDGEYDLAFIGNCNGGFPVCLYFEPPFYPTIIGKWLTTHWTGVVQKHPDGNPWHYAFRDGARGFGKPMSDWYGIENKRIGDKGMSFLSNERGCANGRHIEPDVPSDRHILAGLVRDRDSKEVLTIPSGLTCFYCKEAYQPKERP